MKKELEYLKEVNGLIERVITTQETAIEKACEAVSSGLSRGGYLYAFGTGHSHMLAEEFFYRAGGLVRVYPIFDEDLMLHIDASESSNVERRCGYAEKLLNKLPEIKDGDILFIFSNSGRNAVPVEMAILAKKRGACVICITNLNHSGSVQSRHSSGKKLYQVADIVIDNCGCIGDAAINVEGTICGPTSTAVGAAIVEAIVCGTVERMQKSGNKPEVFCSSNLDGGDEINSGYINKYKKEIPFL